MHAVSATCELRLTIGFAVPTLVLGSDVTTIWSRSIGAPMIDCLSTNELDTGRQTQVNIINETSSIRHDQARCCLFSQTSRRSVLFKLAAGNCQF